MIILLLFFAPLVMSGPRLSQLLQDGILESEDDGALQTFARQLDDVLPSKLDEAEFRREDFEDTPSGSIFGIPTSPPDRGQYRGCGLKRWRDWPCKYVDKNDHVGTNYGCWYSKCWKACSHDCDVPRSRGNWCYTLDDEFLYQKCSSNADCERARAAHRVCFGKKKCGLEYYRGEKPCDETTNRNYFCQLSTDERDIYGVWPKENARYCVRSCDGPCKINGGRDLMWATGQASTCFVSALGTTRQMQSGSLYEVDNIYSCDADQDCKEYRPCAGSVERPMCSCSPSNE